jgi:hypothetical protein
MSTRARIVEALPLGDLRMRLTFSDGLVRELDFAPALTSGSLEELRNPEVFAEVRVDDVAGTISWLNGGDLDPDVLHGDHEPAHGDPATVLREYRLRPTR